MECKYVKKIENEKAIKLFQEQSGVGFDMEYVDFIKVNNGGRPEYNVIQLPDGSEKVVNKFLSFNESDKENIYKAKHRIEEDDEKLIPFASDPAGNYFCFKSSKVYFYGHEDGEEQMIAESFRDFLGMLKE